MEPELVLTLLKIFGVFAGLSFIVFWVGLVWWVSQDVVSRTNDKIILAAAVAFATIFGPVGVLLYLIVRPRQTIKESYREMLETEINRKLASIDMAYCPFCGANLERDVHTPHPDQLSMTDIDIAEEIAEPISQDVLSVRRSEKVVENGKLLSVKVTDSLVKVTRATAKGLTFLLTPLPSAGALPRANESKNDQSSESLDKDLSAKMDSQELSGSAEVEKTETKSGPTIVEPHVVDKPVRSSAKSKTKAKTYSRSGSAKRAKK